MSSGSSVQGSTSSPPPRSSCRSSRSAGSPCYRLGAGGAPVYVVYAQTASAQLPLKSRVFVELVKQILAAEAIARPVARSERPATPRGSRG